MTARTLAPPRTVADLCRLRRNCRAGLSGLRMRHLPTGREFTCLGSWWAAGDALRLQAHPGRKTSRDEVVASIARRLGEGTPAAARAVEGYDRFGLVCLADVRVSPPPENFDAAECVTLGRWPVVCCRPRAARRCPAR